ncbi:hypothetical protein, partial [Mycobacterium sp.]|uniref:hypothetical protein n=1 Tax=Mycobacterium sp. TaxID=1785 RepID=UPI003BAF04B3
MIQTAADDGRRAGAESLAEGCKTPSRTRASISTSDRPKDGSADFAGVLTGQRGRPQRPLRQRFEVRHLLGGGQRHGEVI